MATKWVTVICERLKEDKFVISVLSGLDIEDMYIVKTVDELMPIIQNAVEQLRVPVVSPQVETPSTVDEWEKILSDKEKNQ